MNWKCRKLSSHASRLLLPCGPNVPICSSCSIARIQSILRKADFDFSTVIPSKAEVSLHPKEKDVIKILQQYPETVQLAAKNHSPALIANYTYELVKTYNSFYQSVPILGSENMEEKILRTRLSKKVSDTIKSGFNLLGIDVPERM